MDDTPVYALTSSVEADVIAANAQIESNAGIPTEDGETTRWDVPRLAINQSFYFIMEPPTSGWNGLTQETMLSGVSNVEEKVYSTSWEKPIP